MAFYIKSHYGTFKLLNQDPVEISHSRNFDKDDLVQSFVSDFSLEEQLETHFQHTVMGLVSSIFLVTGRGYLAIGGFSIASNNASMFQNSFYILISKEPFIRRALLEFPLYPLLSSAEEGVINIPLASRSQI